MAAFAPEVITHIGTFPITNTILNTIVVDAALIGSAIVIKKNFSKIPGYFQNIAESVIESFYNLIESISPKNAATIFPFVMTFFLFILIANWSGLIPGFTSIGFFENDHGKKHFAPLLRNATSDINVTLGLALVSLIATHILAIRAVGVLEYLSRYFSLNPILLFVGFLEIISEITKIVSLSFRLFGNIYAGEVVLHTISDLFAFIFPLPFMALEVIVGLVQALVFALLTMVFMAVLMTPHHGDKHHHDKGEEVIPNGV